MTTKADQILDALEGHPKLRFEVARKLNDMHLASPWNDITTPDLEQWVREDITTMVLAIITSEGSGYYWEAVPRDDPNIPYEYKGEEDDIEDAQKAADEVLRQHGWRLTP